MVRLMFSSYVKTKDGNTCTQLALNDFHKYLQWQCSTNANRTVCNPLTNHKYREQQDIERHLADLSNHFDSKLQSLNNLIIKQLSEKINRIEKSVKHISRLHDALIEKINSLKHIISQIKNEQGIDDQVQEIKDLKRQISILQAKVSAIQEQKEQLHSKMSDFNEMKDHMKYIEKNKNFHNYALSNFKENAANKNEKRNNAVPENNNRQSNVQPLDSEKQGDAETVSSTSTLATATTNNGVLLEKQKYIGLIVHHADKAQVFPKRDITRNKIIQLKNKILKTARKMRFKQDKRYAV